MGSALKILSLLQLRNRKKPAGELEPPRLSRDCFRAFGFENGDSFWQVPLATTSTKTSEAKDASAGRMIVGWTVLGLTGLLTARAMLLRRNHAESLRVISRSPFWVGSRLVAD